MYIPEHPDIYEIFKLPLLPKLIMHSTFYSFTLANHASCKAVLFYYNDKHYNFHMGRLLSAYSDKLRNLNFGQTISFYCLNTHLLVWVFTCMMHIYSLVDVYNHYRNNQSQKQKQLKYKLIIQLQLNQYSVVLGSSVG